mgnify:CR=1 FL=1
MNKKQEEYLIRRISKNETHSDLLSFPRYIEIETINACNARCPMCTINDWKRNSKPMNDEMFEKIAKELIAHANVLKRVSLYRDGEPLLDKKLAKRIAILKEGGVKNVAISTNVSLLTEEKAKEILNAGIDFVMMSIDSLKKEVYEGIRVNLKFEDVLKNAINFIKLRDTIRPETKIWIRMVRQESNYNEWNEYKKFWSEKTSPGDRIYYHFIANWGGQLANFKPISKSYEPNLPCVALWSLFVIFSDGDVSLCNVDYNKKYSLGNIMSNSIKELWQSKLISEKRDLHLNGRKKEICICKNCNVWDEPIDLDPISSEYADSIELSD